MIIFETIDTISIALQQKLRFHHLENDFKSGILDQTMVYKCTVVLKKYFEIELDESPQYHLL